VQQLTQAYAGVDEEGGEAEVEVREEEGQGGEEELKRGECTIHTIAERDTKSEGDK
jgi:hypothetical protein